MRNIHALKEICLPNKEYISGHISERINMGAKCIIHMHITAELKAYWCFVYFSLHSLFSCKKKIILSCGYIGLSALALLSNSSNCIVLILFTQLGNSLFMSCN